MTPLPALEEAEKQRRRKGPEPFIAWPSWAHLRFTILLSVVNTLWFVLVFGGADYLTARRSFRVPVHFAAELSIPLVPAMSLIYMSIYLLFLSAPFILRTRQEIRALVGTLAFLILCGGIGFLLFPAELAFETPQNDTLGMWAGLYHFADKLNLTYNLLPSLHVALSVACVSAFCSRASRMGRALLWLWAGTIAASTVLIHQHHVLDVATGWLLAIACTKFVFYRTSPFSIP